VRGGWRKHGDCHRHQRNAYCVSEEHLPPSEPSSEPLRSTSSCPFCLVNIACNGLFNSALLACLASGTSSLDSGLQSVCAAWDECLPAESKAVLKVLLKISGASLTGSSFADKVSTQGNLTTYADPNGCIDPAVDDPESWDCECVEDMKTSCGGVDEACFKGILCGKAEICQTWKDDAECPTFLVQKSEDEISGTHSSEALGQRSQAMLTRQKGQEDVDLSGSLDGSLGGKCTPETQ